MIKLFVALIFIAFLGFYQAFYFDFLGEEWEQLWFILFDPAKINNPSIMQHPIVLYEESLLAKLFSFNTYFWQIEGFILKVLSSFAIGLMMFGLAKSRKAAILSSLIFAGAVGGLSSFTWVAAHTSALLIPFISLGIYFWITSFENNLHIRGKFVLALSLLIFSFWADPSRGIFAAFIVIFWEFLSFIQNPQNLKLSLKRVLILSLSIFAIFFLYQYILNYHQIISIRYNVNLVLSNPAASLNNFLTNIGTLLAGWIIPMEQNLFAVSKMNPYSQTAGYLFLIFMLFLSVVFIKKRNEPAKIFLILSVWVPLFFFPNWLLPNQEMIGNGQVLGISHRYFTLSAAGLACLLGYGLSKLRKASFGYILLFFAVGFNLLSSNRILKNESEYRSVKITGPIWDQIEQEVPQGADNIAIFIKSDDLSRTISISQAKIPFAIRRNIRLIDKWPASTGDPRTIKELLCGQITDKPQLPLSHLYAWDIKSTTAQNISEKVRSEFAIEECKLPN